MSLLNLTNIQKPLSRCVRDNELCILNTKIKKINFVEKNPLHYPTESEYAKERNTDKSLLHNNEFKKKFYKKIYSGPDSFTVGYERVKNINARRAL